MEFDHLSNSAPNQVYRINPSDGKVNSYQVVVAESPLQVETGLKVNIIKRTPSEID